MQGMVNLSSFGLLIGAFGLQWFFLRFPLHVSHWLLLCLVFLPWIVVYAISFCNAPPFGLRAYRFSLIGVMGWFATLTVLAEIGQYVWRLPPDGHIPITAARCLTCVGWLSFIPFVLAIRSIRKFEKEEPPNQALYATSEPAPFQGTDSEAGER